MRSDLWRWGFKAREVQRDFDAALGFVPRRGIRSFAGDVGWNPRPTGGARGPWDVRQYHVSLEGQLVTSTDGHVSWTTVGASPSIVESSFLAVADALEYGILQVCTERKGAA